jgi:hypothetical protein
MTLSLVEPVMNEQQKYPPQADYHPFVSHRFEAGIIVALATSQESTFGEWPLCYRNPFSRHF